MQRIQFFIGFILLILLEYYLRLVVSGWPIVLVPEFIIFFTVINKKNRGNLVIALFAICVYDFCSVNLPGVNVIALVSILILSYILSAIIDFDDNIWLVSFATLAGVIFYLLLTSSLDSYFLSKIIPELIVTSWPSLRAITVVLLETVAVISIFNLKIKLKN